MSNRLRPLSATRPRVDAVLDSDIDLESARQWQKAGGHNNEVWQRAVCSAVRAGKNAQEAATIADEVVLFERFRFLKNARLVRRVKKDAYQDQLLENSQELADKAWDDMWTILNGVLLAVAAVFVFVSSMYWLK